MVLMLDGNSEIGAHVRGYLCYLIKAFDEIERSQKSNFYVIS